jgi:hypothetical protein
MDDANLPTFPDGFRLLVLTPTQCKQLADDPQFQRASSFHPQYNILFPQYLKSCGKFHIFKSTTLNQTNNSHTVKVHYGHAIAPGALMAGMGRPLRVVQNTNDNYGETALVVWLGDLAFGLADSRFAPRLDNNVGGARSYRRTWRKPLYMERPFSKGFHKWLFVMAWHRPRARSTRLSQELPSQVQLSSWATLPRR